MKVKIDIEEILSPQEIKEIAKDVVSNQLNRLYSGAEENLQMFNWNMGWWSRTKHRYSYYDWGRYWYSWWFWKRWNY